MTTFHGFADRCNGLLAAGAIEERSDAHWWRYWCDGERDPHAAVGRYLDDDIPADANGGFSPPPARS